MSRLPREQETATARAVAPLQPALSGSLARLRAVMVAWLGVLFGVHTLFSALLLLGYKTSKPSEWAIFTAWGRELYHPERDIPLYILFCGLTFAICLVMMSLWNRHYAALPPEQRYRFAIDNIASNFALALAATFLNPLWFFTAKRLARLLLPHWVIGEFIMVMPALAEAVLFLLLLKRNSSGQTRAIPRFRRLLEAKMESDAAHASAVPRDGNRAERVAWNWRDTGFLLLIWLLVYSPRPDVMAGYVFQSEHFHHWDYFVMGPALGYVHGQALNTQVYSQYGIGFPLMFALLNPLYALSYGHIFQFTNIYTCFYICGVYLFLRLLLKNPLWAAAGAITFVYYKLFNWTTVWLPPYQLPSNTVLRGPFDIWFLLMLLLHQQSRNARWLLLAGVFTGLSLLFETDTGVYITFTFVVYSVFHLRRAADGASPDPSPRAGQIAQVGGAWLLFSSVFLSGMTIASRGTVGQAAFWRGWIECFTAYPNGISMMPVAEHVEGLFYGMIMVGVYLLALCYHFHRLHDREDNSEDANAFRPDLVLLCVALYGTCSLLHFMGRSHPTNLHVSFMAFLLLCVTGLHTLSHDALRLWADTNRAVRLRRLVWAALVVYGLFTWWHEPHARAYPNYVRMLLKPIQPREITLYIDDKGRKQDPHQGLWPRFVEHSESEPLDLYPGSGVSLPQSLSPKLQQYTPVIAEARRLSLQGKKVAILANDETWMYLASGAMPWYRYSPFYPNLITKTQLATAKSALLADHVDYVFIEASPPVTTFVAWHPLALYTTDVWREMRQFTAQNFQFEHVVGLYEVWKR